MFIGFKNNRDLPQAIAMAMPARKQSHKRLMLSN